MSQSSVLNINPIDPLIARDGRPFIAGGQMKSLDWFYPSTVAGSLRTLLGKKKDGKFPPALVEKLKNTRVAGPFPCIHNKLYFPSPKDMILREAGDSIYAHALLPQDHPKGVSCIMPDAPAGLKPVYMNNPPNDDFKPERPPLFWSQDVIFKWLAGDSGACFSSVYRKDLPGGLLIDQSGKALEFIPDIPQDHRFHVKIDPDKNAAEEHMLFKTASLVFDKKMSASIRVEPDPELADTLSKDLGIHPLGGERRPAYWQMADTGSSGLWECPKSLKSTLQNARYLKLMLATPAIFQNGWYPGWIDADGLGLPISDSSVRLKLISACVDRWLPISGFSLEDGNWGPKPVCRMVPAGSVYFFEVQEGNADELIAKTWLQSVSDHEVHKADGFGLALWGVWNHTTKGE